MSTMNKPSPDEYNPAYQPYIDLVPDGDFQSLLNLNSDKVVQFFQSIDVGKHNYRYQQNKWTVKDVLMHIIDTERGFSFRAFVCVREDPKIPLYSLEEDLYATNVDVTNRDMKDLIDEFLTVRRSMEFIYKHATPSGLEFPGNGIGHMITARAIGYIAIGHVIHHMNIIKERYL